MPRILSFDIDLNRTHAWSSQTGRVCYNAKSNEIPFSVMLDHDVILAEVSSNVFYDRRPHVVHRTAAWLIYNTYIATILWTWATHYQKQLLVAPSSEWSLGYPEEDRHATAGVVGDNHDIREVRCMQFFYSRNPKKWVPFETYFNSFSFKAEPKPAAKAAKGKR